MNITKQKGLITELHCQLAFSELGLTICAPMCEDCRYDFVADIDGKFIRLQCKTSSLKEDGSGIVFSTRSTRVNTQEAIQRYYTKDEIDYFYTYYNGKSYLVKVEETSSIKTLRFWTNSNNTQNICFAKDYELEEVLKRDFKYQDFQYNEINIISSDKKICPKCGAEMNKKSVLCSKCSHEERRLVERPTREILKNEIRSIPFLQIGEKYGVSDNAIRKWCKAENLPYRKKDIEKYSEEEWKEV